jgi:polyisoprenoid-binding protein YceI
VDKFDRANAMTTHYHFDAIQSHMTVQAFSSGLLSFLGHNPIFDVRDLSGTVSVPDDMLEGLELVLSVPADSLEVISDLKPAERREIAERTRSEVLETVLFPTISFRASTAAMLRVNPGKYRVKLDGSLSLHGVVRHHRVELEMVQSSSIRFVGESHLHMSDFLIRPVTALGGALRLKDAVKLTFDLVALPESGLDQPAEQFSEGELSHMGIGGNG